MRFSFSALFASLLVAAGCGDAGTIRAGSDGGASDGPSADSGPGAPDDEAVPATDDSLGFVAMEPPADVDPEARDDTDLLLRQSCYDGEDNDAINGTDCRDEGCRELGSCCVGDGDCCAPSSIPDLPSAIDFTSCTSFDACLGADAWSFIGTAASLSPEGMSPEGSALGEGGVALLTPVDVSTRRLTLTLDITPPDECGSMSCVESLGLGLVDQPPASGEGITIEPPIAIVYSGARDAVSVMREGTELARLPRGSATELELVAKPTGEMAVTVGTESFALSGAFDPRPLHIAIYGRTRNPGASDMRATALGSLSIDTELCDMPDAWGAREALGFDAGEPSIARDGSTTRIAYVDVDGGIAMAELADDAWVELPGRLGHEELGDGYKRIGDPELLFDGTWQLYFTAEEDDGTTWIWRASYDEDFVADGSGILEGARAPTIATSTLGAVVMVVLTDEGLVPYRLADEGFWRRLETSLLGPVANTLGEEIGTASLVQHNRAWHLYVSVRRGARWSIHLLSSDEILAWRDVGRALASGDDFDRINVRAPDVWAEGNLLRMVYEAHDGIGRNLGFATRVSTAGGTF